jgi:hypothetical protein
MAERSETSVLPGAGWGGESPEAAGITGAPLATEGSLLADDWLPLCPEVTPFATVLLAGSMVGLLPEVSKGAVAKVADRDTGVAEAAVADVAAGCG